MRKISVSLAAAIAALLVATSASAATAPTVDAFSASLGATTINVSGAATFADEAVEVAFDTSEAVNQGKVPGTNITTASISRPKPATNSLRFSMAVANQPPATNGVPLVPYFVWEFFVNTPSGASFEFLLLATRASAEGTDTDPDFALWTCVPNPPGPSQCSAASASITGEFTETGVDVNVPTGPIGAVPGSTITSTGTNNIYVTPGIGTPVGSATTGIFLEALTQSEDYVVPGPTVQVGVAPAGTAAEDVTLTKAGTFKSDGTFTATLPRPEAGGYVVAARVCYTATACTLTSTDLTV